MTEETNIPSQEVEVVPQPKPKRKPKKAAAEGIAATTPSGRGNGSNLKKDKIGTPTLGRSPNYVTRVGLGNLQVVSAQGLKDETN